MKRSWMLSLPLLIGLAAASCIAFLALRPPALAEGIAYGNGHIEGVEVRIASEAAGRVVEHTLVEGQTVRAGQRLVTIDPRSFHDELAAVQGELAAVRATQAALDAQIATWTHHAETAQRQAERLRRLGRRPAGNGAGAGPCDRCRARSHRPDRAPACAARDARRAHR